MFSIVFHVWGKLNRTFSSAPQGDALLDYYDQYVRWTDPNMPPSLQVYMDQPGLVQGYYNVWIEGSLATQYPDLVNLFGYDAFDDGSSKYMGQQLRTNTNRPVPSQTSVSRIESHPTWHTSHGTTNLPWVAKNASNKSPSVCARM